MSLARYSWVLAAVGGVGIIVFGSLWFVTGEVGAVAQASGVLGALALIAYAFVDRDRLKEGASGREALAGAGAFLAVVLGIALSGLLVALASQYDQTADLTRSGTYTLSTRTQSVLDGLDEEVTLYGIFRPGQQRDRFERLTDLYALQSSQVRVELIDPLTQPAKAGALVRTTGNAEMDRLSELGTVLLAQGSRRRRLESRFDEEALTNAIVKLSSGEDKRVCWSVGHGERDPDDDQGQIGWGGVILRLEDRNMVLTESRILTAGVDRDCDALMIVGPTRDFQPMELEAVAAYIAEGGQVFLAVDAPPEGIDLPNLREELERYGIAMGEDVIVENSAGNVTQGPSGEPLYVYDAVSFKQHPIMELGSLITPRWPRSVQATDQPVGIEVRELAASTERSWAETNLTFDEEALPQPDPDEQVGPIPFIVLAEILDPAVLEVGALPAAPPPADTDTDAPVDPGAPLPFQQARASLVPDDLTPEAGGRLFVIGDADLGANPLAGSLSNGDLVLNALSFLADEEDQIGDDAKASETLLLSDAGAAVVYLVGIFLVPFLALVAGVGFLVRRRFL